VFDGDFINVPGMLQAYKDGNWVKVAFIVRPVPHSHPTLGGGFFK
jgi:hypothetical protein